MKRRNFIKIAAATIAALATRKLPAIAKPEQPRPWWNPDGECEPVAVWQCSDGWVFNFSKTEDRLTIEKWKAARDEMMRTDQVIR